MSPQLLELNYTIYYLIVFRKYIKLLNCLMKIIKQHCTKLSQYETYLILQNAVKIWIRRNLRLVFGEDKHLIRLVNSTKGLLLSGSCDNPPPPPPPIPAPSSPVLDKSVAWKVASFASKTEVKNIWVAAVIIYQTFSSIPKC